MKKRPNVVIVVLGNQLDELGRVVPGFKARLAAGLEHLRHWASAVMVITGGQTRPGFPSEAEAGRHYIFNELLGKSDEDADLDARILVETEARSTSEHPALVRKLLGDDVARIKLFIFVTSEHHVWRSRWLFRKLWLDSQRVVLWEGVRGHSTWQDWLREPVYFVAERYKRRYRNAGT